MQVMDFPRILFQQIQVHAQDKIHSDKNLFAQHSSHFIRKLKKKQHLIFCMEAKINTIFQILRPVRLGLIIPMQEKTEKNTSFSYIYLLSFHKKFYS